MQINSYLYKKNNKKNKKDIIFNSFWISKLINNVRGHTAASKIEKLAYKSFAFLKQYYKIPVPLIIFNFLKSQKLLFKITKVRVAGRIYLLPISFNEFNRYSMFFRQSLKQLRLQHSNTFVNKFIDLINNNVLLHQNAKTKQEIYKTIVSFRGYLHYRWRI